eukprot:4448943-Amphidinium_carterae.1
MLTRLASWPLAGSDGAYPPDPRQHLGVDLMFLVLGALPKVEGFAGAIRHHAPTVVLGLHYHHYHHPQQQQQQEKGSCFCTLGIGHKLLYVYHGEALAESDSIVVTIIATLMCTTCAMTLL